MRMTFDGRLVVDAHHHLWDPTKHDYPWMSGAFEPLRRPFGVDDLLRATSTRAVDATIVVQARHDIGETRELLLIAAQWPLVAGVVGWVDLTAPDIADALAELRAGPGGAQLVGIRHQVHDEPDHEWLMRPDVGRGLEAVAHTGLSFDLLVRSRELPAALRVAQDHPSLRFVIDHLAKPEIRSGEVEPWASLLSPFGPLVNVYAKLSGLVTEADWTTWSQADLTPYVGHALDVFGPSRLLFGSDWPVCLLAAPYQQVFDAAVSALDGLSSEELASVLGRSAFNAYRALASA